MASSPDNAEAGQHCQMIGRSASKAGRCTKGTSFITPLKSKTTSFNLADMGWVAVHAGEASDSVVVDVDGAEATRKVCGVLVAMPLGHNWAPRLPNGSW
jgi:hypothetical protein